MRSSTIELNTIETKNYDDKQTRMHDIREHYHAGSLATLVKLIKNTKKADEYIPWLAEFANDYNDELNNAISNTFLFNAFIQHEDFDKVFHLLKSNLLFTQITHHERNNILTKLLIGNPLKNNFSDKFIKWGTSEKRHQLIIAIQANLNLQATHAYTSLSDLFSILEDRSYDNYVARELLIFHCNNLISTSSKQYNATEFEKLLIKLIKSNYNDIIAVRLIALQPWVNLIKDDTIAHFAARLPSEKLLMAITARAGNTLFQTNAQGESAINIIIKNESYHLLNALLQHSDFNKKYNVYPIQFEAREKLHHAAIQHNYTHILINHLIHQPYSISVTGQNKQLLIHRLTRQDFIDALIKLNISSYYDAWDNRLPSFEHATYAIISENPLYNAIKQYNTNLVSILLDKGLTEHINECFLYATEISNKAIINKFLKHIEKLNNDTLNLALVNLAKQSNLDVDDILLNLLQYPKLSLKPESGWNLVSTKTINFDFLSKLLPDNQLIRFMNSIAKSYRDKDQIPLFAALKEDRETVFSWLCQQGELASETDNNKVSILETAIITGKYHYIDLLFKFAHRSLNDDILNAGLVLSIKKGKWEIATKLLDHISYVNCLDKDGQLILIHAAKYKASLPMFDILLKRNENYIAQNNCNDETIASYIINNKLHTHAASLIKHCATELSQNVLWEIAYNSIKHNEFELALATIIHCTWRGHVKQPILDEMLYLAINAKQEKLAIALAKLGASPTPHHPLKKSAIDIMLDTNQYDLLRNISHYLIDTADTLSYLYIIHRLLKKNELRLAHTFILNCDKITLKETFNDVNKNTILHLAVIAKDEKLVAAILPRVTDISDINTNNQTAFMLALSVAMQNNTLLQHFLTSNNLLSNDHLNLALLSAFGAKNISLIKSILNTTGFIYQPNMKDRQGNQALHYLCSADFSMMDGWLECVKTLLNQGAKLSVLNNYNLTPFDIALNNPNLTDKLFNELISHLHSTDFDTKAKGKWVLDLCREGRFNNASALCYQFIPDMSVVDELCNSALHYVVSNTKINTEQQRQLITTFCNHGASIYTTNIYKIAPIDHAISQSIMQAQPKHNLVKLLVQCHPYQFEDQHAKLIPYFNKFDDTKLLIEAIQEHDIPSIKWLCTNGVLVTKSIELENENVKISPWLAALEVAAKKGIIQPLITLLPYNNYFHQCNSLQTLSNLLCDHGISIADIHSSLPQNTKRKQKLLSLVIETQLMQANSIEKVFEIINGIDKINAAFAPDNNFPSLFNRHKWQNKPISEIGSTVYQLAKIHLLRVCSSNHYSAEKNKEMVQKFLSVNRDTRQVQTKSIKTYGLIFTDNQQANKIIADENKKLNNILKCY